MSLADPRPLADYLANDVRDRADDLVEEWIDWIGEHSSLRPARLLPREAIRDHLPSVLRGIIESLRTSVEAQGIEAALRTHARLRLDQGYDVEELLQEYRGLSHLVADRMLHALERYPGNADPVEVARIFIRISEGLATMSERTVGEYRRTEVSQRRELHSQLEDYVRTITHELKQPLHAITSGAGALEDDPDAGPAGRQGHYLRIIRRGVDRAAHLIDDIRALALFEGAQQTEEWAPLESSLAQIVHQLEDQAGEKGVRIAVRRPLPAIEVDSARVEIALVNLISNAIKYADPGKPDRWVRVEVERADDDEEHLWRVSVTDNGLGIPEPLHRQIFERHFRAHPDVDEGTGLGLSITRQVIEQVGGRIWFESEDGRGSAFHFTVVGHAREGERGEAHSVGGAGSRAEG